MIQKFFQAFAAIDMQNERRQLQHYKQWVARLADREFADELIILAVVLELRIRLVCIPFTPPDSLGQWAITTYASPSTPAGLEIVLGNNDVHYMWLTPI